MTTLWPSHALQSRLARLAGAAGPAVDELGRCRNRADTAVFHNYAQQPAHQQAFMGPGRGKSALWTGSVRARPQDCACLSGLTPSFAVADAAFPLDWSVGLVGVY